LFFDFIDWSEFDLPAICVVQHVHFVFVVTQERKRALEEF
jgi:hypothetical protein